MSVYCAFLRGINVGGHNKIKMADLREALSASGLTDVQTILQSGNAVFGSADGDEKTVASVVQSAAREAADIDCHVMVRSAGDMLALKRRNPFAGAATEEPKWLLVMFLEAAAPEAAVEALRAAYQGPEDIAVSGREAFVFYKDGIGRSKLTPALLERHLGPGTARNWQTISKVTSIAEALSA